MQLMRHPLGLLGLALAAPGLLLLGYLVSLKRSVALGRNLPVLQALGMGACMRLNKHVVFHMYGVYGLTLQAQAQAKCDLLAAQAGEITPRHVCFLGSSTFTYWRNLREDFAPGRLVYNAGFGGSTTLDLFPCLNGLVFRFAPQTIVYYCGINDVGAGRTGREAFQGFAEFVAEVRKQLPQARVVYVGMILSPYHLFCGNAREVGLGNGLAKEFCERQGANMAFVDTQTLHSRSLYVNDGLHLNDHGHRLLGELILPAL
ncbi:hypothetical protein BASA81_002770 [Batrachochytrium salamandrivorans]|nr:hypothetical protein BASA81_002770 [Batrachochytrium salamandrivorans]